MRIKARSLVVLSAVLVALVAVELPMRAVGVAEAAQTNAPKARATAVEVTVVAGGLANPWALQFLPDGRMLVSEREGQLRIVTPDGQISAPIAGVPAVHAVRQGGLLDVRLANDFATSGTIFISYSEPRRVGTSATAVARGRLILDPSNASGRIEDLKVIFQQNPEQSTSHHYGSRIVIASDGTLFVTTGDRGNGDLAQDPSTTIGKVIHINPDGSVPANNPKPPGWAPEIWSIGHRNLQGAVVDPKSGRLWTVEHGARGGDELNHPEAGKNYGWPVVSYGRNYSGTKIGVGTAKAGMEQPVYYWDPSIAVSGLAFYDGALFPSWKGNLLVGGLAGAQLTRLVLDNGAVVSREVLLADRGDRVRDVRVGPDGAVYLLTDDSDGQILKLRPKGSRK